MRLTLILALALLASPATAQTVTDASTRATHGPEARVVATVSSRTGDAITGGSSPAASMVMAHTVRRGDAMAPEAIPVGPRPRVLSVHGYHIMLERLRRPLIAGEHVPVTVHFRSGADVPVTVTVR